MTIQKEPFIIHISPEAQLYLEGNLEDACLRIGVAKGGCSGLMYHIEEADTPTADDYVIQVGGKHKLIVEKNIGDRYLNGISLVLLSTGYGQMLSFENPNAKHACGCKESFSIEEDEA